MILNHVCCMYFNQQVAQLHNVSAVMEPEMYSWSSVNTTIILNAFLGLLHEVHFFSLGPSTITSVNNNVTLHQTVPCFVIRYMNNGCNQGSLCV